MEDKVDLAQRVVQRVVDTAGVLRSLGNFSEAKAQELEGELANEVEEVIQRVGRKALEEVERVLEERDVSLEDVDSSSTVHLLMRLKARAEALTGQGDE